MPFVSWDVNQWKFKSGNDYTSLGLHETLKTKEVIRPQTSVTVIIPNGVPDLHRVQADAKNELEDFVEAEFGSLDTYPEIIQDFIQTIVNQTNAEFLVAEEIDDLVNILLATKKILIAAKPIANQKPETLDGIKTSAKAAVNDYATAYNYTPEKQAEINGYVLEANAKIDASNEILDIVNSYDELKDLVNQVFILQDVVAKDLFISEYANGTGTDRYLEIYNGTKNPIDLSIYGIRVFPSAVSGLLTDATVIPLSGTLDPNKTFVIAHEDASAEIKAKADLLSAGACAFDGNDAIALVKKNTSITNGESSICSAQPSIRGRSIRGFPKMPYLTRILKFTATKSIYWMPDTIQRNRHHQRNAGGSARTQPYLPHQQPNEMGKGL